MFASSSLVAGSDVLELAGGAWVDEWTWIDPASDDPGTDDLGLLDELTIAELEELSSERPYDPDNYNPAPGPSAAELFERTDFSRLDSDQLVDAMIGLGRLASWAQARQSQVIAEFAGRRPPTYIHDGGFAGRETISRYVSDEVSCALSLTTRSAGVRVELALRLAEALPATLAAWGRGDLDWPRVSVIADRTSVLDPDQAHAVELTLLARLTDKTTGQTRQIVDRAVIAANPAAANKRHEEARLRRDVITRPFDDGMSTLTATLTAEETALAHGVLNGIAVAAPKDDPRTIGQRRADALMGLITGRVRFPASQSDPASTVAVGEPSEITLSTTLPELLGGTRPLIQVVVGAGTLAGNDEFPAEIVGHGPIPSELARRLAADGVWRRILTDPASGAVLDYGHTRYRPPAALVDFIRARDQVCTFPTCRISARHCQIDHAIPYDKNGQTNPANTGPLCVRHHLLKTHTGWTITRHSNGTVVWTSPSGHRYTNYPDDYRVFIAPERSPQAEREIPLDLADPPF